MPNPPPASIDFSTIPSRAQLPHQLAHPLHGRAKRLGRANLRADMHAHAVRFQPAIAGRALVNRQPPARISTPNLCSRSPVEMYGMRIGKHIGIHAQRKPRLALHPARARREQLQLRLALHVELENVRLKRAVDLRRRLAHAGKHHPPRSLRRRGQHPFQFAAGNNVEARPALRQQLQNRQRRIGLHRVAHQVIAPRQRSLKQRQPLQQSGRPSKHKAACRTSAPMNPAKLCRRQAPRRAAGILNGRAQIGVRSATNPGPIHSQNFRNNLRLSAHRARSHGPRPRVSPSRPCVSVPAAAVCRRSPHSALYNEAMTQDGAKSPGTVAQSRSGRRGPQRHRYAHRAARLP